MLVGFMLRDTPWCQGHAGSGAVIAGCNVAWQNGAKGAPAVRAGALQRLQGARDICSEAK